MGSPSRRSAWPPRSRSHRAIGLVLRRTSGTERVVGATVLDTAPPRGISRRRQSIERVARLATAVGTGDRAAIAAARLDLHGALEPVTGPVAVAPGVRTDVGTAVVEAVEGAMTLTTARAVAARELRRRVTLGRDAAASAAAGLVDELVRDGRLTRDDLHVRRPGTAPAAHELDSTTVAAMDRLERALAVAAPPALGEAARAAACPPDGVRALDRGGPDPRPRTRPGLCELDLSDAGGPGAGDVVARTADPGGLPRRDRHEPQVRHGHPRRPRPARDPAPDGSGPRARSTSGGWCVMTTADISVIVLAGGRSSRFGRDKLAEPLDGRPLLHHAIDAVRPIAAEIIVVAAPDASPALPPDVTLVHDAVAFEGPLAGLLAGLAAARSPTVLVVGGDMPALSVAVLESMVALLTESDANAVVLEDGGRGRPLPMALRREPGADDGAPRCSPGVSGASVPWPMRCRRPCSRRRPGGLSTRTARRCATSTPKRIWPEPDGPGHTKTSAGGSGGRRVSEGGGEG